jgi:transcription elongation factor GreB
MATEKNNLITPDGFKKLVEEYNQLAEERPKVVEEVSAAARQGDRSENAEYIYGKRRLRQIDSRMHFLSTRIDSARVINPKDQHGDKVMFGATVTIADETDRKSVYQIVGIDESDVGKGKISWKSPVGAALIQKCAGDFAEVETPKGVVVYRIVGFEFK